MKTDFVKMKIECLVNMVRADHSLICKLEERINSLSEDFEEFSQQKKSKKTDKLNLSERKK